MKFTSAIALILALSASCIGTAQSADMKDMDMKGMEMKDTGNKPPTNGPEATTHKTTAVVKAVDAPTARSSLRMNRSKA